MIGLIEFSLVGACVVLAIPTLVFAAEILGALFARAETDPSGPGGRLAVIVPAHNEALGIGGVLQGLMPQLGPGDRLLVVADNCDDDTAAIAAAHGAQVAERRDLTRRGKGYALAHGISQLASDPPDTVIIVDADCRPAPGALTRLAQACRQHARPVQALYLMRTPPGAGARMRIAEFAWIVKNEVRPLGLRTLGFGCQLMGTGMAFPWTQISTAELATGHIVEDMKLGLDLARRGFAPRFLAEALVESDFPTAAEGVDTQRTRWEHGHLGVIVSEAPKTLIRALRAANLPLLALALDLCVPPVALLGTLLGALAVAGAGLYAWSGRPVAALSGGALLIVFVLVVLAAWRRFARQVVGATDFLHAALYALRKLPMYFRFFRGRQVQWVRSKREGE